MEFNFIKKAIGNSSDGPASDLFNSSNLNTRKVTILAEQYYELFDEFRKKRKVSLSYLHSYLIDFIFTNMGGNNDTRVIDVLSFSYMLLNTDVFKFQHFVNETVVAINFDIMCYFIQENKLVAPSSFLVSVAEKLNNENLYNIIVDRFSFEVNNNNSAEELSEFYSKMINNINPFMEGVISTNELLSDLDIGLN